jgi:hypothetical protein
MKKTIYTLLVIMNVVLLSSCSSAKVLNSWKADNIADVRDNNMLVIARTDNTSARIAFENEIVKELTSRGIKATASFEKIPKLNPDKEITEDDQKKIKTMLMDHDFDGVVLTVIKEEQELTKTVTDGGYYAGSNYYGFYPRYYNGFYGYYRNPMSYSTLGNYVEQTTETYTAKNYILETVIYNLDEPEDKQLVAVVTSKLEEPDNAATTAKQYVKAISKSFDKKK